MDGHVTGLIASDADCDAGNQSDTSRTNEISKVKKKSKTLNRLRKLKKTNGTISPTTGLSPRPPDGKPEDTDRIASHGSLRDVFNQKDSKPNITNGEAQADKNETSEASTPIKVNSAFVANVSFGGSSYRPSPPPKITDGKDSVTDKPRPVPRRRIITPPLSQETTPIQESQELTSSKLKNEKHQRQHESDSVSQESHPEVTLNGRKSSSTLNIREFLPSDESIPVELDRPLKTDDSHNSKETKGNPVMVFDPATGEMVMRGGCNKVKPGNVMSPVQKKTGDSSSEDDLVIPMSGKKTSNSHRQPLLQKEPGITKDKKKDGTKENLTSSNISKGFSKPIKASPLRTSSQHQVNEGLLLNGNVEDSDSDDDIIVVSLAHKGKKKATPLPAVNSAETQNLVGKHDSSRRSKVISSPLPVKEVIETESSFIVKPRGVPSEPHTPSQESGVESDRSTTGSNYQDDMSSEPGTSSMHNKLPPIQSKHTMQSVSSQSLRTSCKMDGSLHLKDGQRSDSLPFSEPVMGANDTLSMTNRSFMSTGALPTLTTKAVKNRSYLSGGLQATNSLLGKEELERYFPDRQLKIFMATWNMHSEKDLPRNLEDLLLPDDTVFVQDIYAIGTQESCPEKQEWEVSIQQVLGPTHVLLHSASHGVLNLLIFIRRDLIWFCSPIEEDRVSTRVGSMIKTKGAMAVAFNFFGTSLLFIASHLTSGDEKLNERILDYEKIISTLQLPLRNSPIRSYNKSSTDVTAKFDCVFWCGDFNFRIDLPKERVEKWILNMKKKDEPSFKKLLKEDQLLKEMKRKAVFKNFKEGEISFFPTYKFDLNTDQYDTSPKARVPSYTDRILYRSRKSGEVQVHVYNSCETIQISDHQPVYAVFTAKIRPGRHDMPTGGGQFARDVFVEGNKRRAAATGNAKSSTVCVIL
ncbi:phosphatidylinositol polyphosphate 5-phosphatase type IV-like isoform X2 [Anneissia japonica]|uniref:phosphatidylinositol polyphosphate 5-phosphatase type IV-like isoform X2 n=1 Tax=Anneissia japonica TaxID=1529436 RepID=UPI001425A6C8|nr:phosphatidylinositol polyphosphate 5-phosphatase type IV-like isoform X2 [Anneissia japonica]